MADETPEQVMEAVVSLRAEVKKVTQNEEQLKNMHEFLDGIEEANQKAVAEHVEITKQAGELKERMAELEIALARSSSSPGKANYKESNEFKAMQAFCIGGEKGLALQAEEVKAALRTDIDPSGGYLVHSEMDTSVLKKVTEIDPIRGIARVRTTAGKTMNLPVRATIPEAEFEGEAEEGEESNSTYESETLTPFRLTYTAPITVDMLMDAAFDMESEIMADAAEAFAFKEGKLFVLGNGPKRPSGFLADARVTDTFLQSATAGKLSAEDMILVTGQLKAGYNAQYVLNRRTLAKLRTEKSTTGEFIWLPGINGVVMNTIAGEPYVISNSMPNIGTGAFAVAYGDFLRGYTIIDRTGMSVIRDDLTKKKKAIVEFTMNRWVTGQVTLPEALTGIVIQ